MQYCVSLLGLKGISLLAHKKAWACFLLQWCHWQAQPSGLWNKKVLCWIEINKLSYTAFVFWNPFFFLCMWKWKHQIRQYYWLHLLWVEKYYYSILFDVLIQLCCNDAGMKTIKRNRSNVQHWTIYSLINIVSFNILPFCCSGRKSGGIQ